MERYGRSYSLKIRFPYRYAKSGYQDRGARPRERTDIVFVTNFGIPGIFDDRGWITQ
jgi:hypothetical protein